VHLQKRNETWLLVTRNRGKAREFEILLSEQGIVLLTLEDIGVTDEIEENGETFEENAAIKVDALAHLSPYTVIADDSGLEVDALNGAPGIYSARFAGERSNDARNRKKLLAVLGKEKQRTARFVCALGYRKKGGQLHMYRGTCEGRIALQEAGGHGFGYDPVFIPEGYERTFGELDPEVKMKMSHRARAVEMLLNNISQRRQ
jgi:XTP/dITP diphosphohydrolase